MPRLKYDQLSNEWIQHEGTEGVFLDGYLKNKLDRIKLMLKKNWDCVFIITGMEGSGKSTLGFICGQYLSDMSLTINNIAEGSSDAIKKLEAMPNKSVLIVDEAELLFSSRETMKREQKQLTQIMMTIRQKNMVLILVCPSFFDLSKYIAVDRSRFVIRTYTDKKLNRGYFIYWGEKKKKKLYQLGKKNFGSYDKPKGDFHGKFFDYKLPFDDNYQELKKKSLREAFGGKLKEDKKIELPREILTELVKRIRSHVPTITSVTLGKVFDVESHIIRGIWGGVDELPTDEG
jgi:hypothetical protein